MKGDFTRLRFDPRMHYDSVLMQQGRVQTDSDWNEQVLIAEYRNRTQVGDIIGPTGAPQDTAVGGRGAFLVYCDLWEGLSKPFINAGRYYVDGLMVESEAVVRYEAQPGATLPPPGDAGGPGTYLVYLDVWKRHITAIEDPAIREVALAGVDAGTRSKLTWQVRMERIGDLSKTIGDIDARLYGPGWQPADTASTGELDAKTESTPTENQLYRVEIHRGGNASKASFKWSRDNGTIASRVLTSTPPLAITVDEGGPPMPGWQFSVTLDQSGRDSFSSFLPGNRVEITCEERTLQRLPGLFGKLIRVGGDTLDVEVTQDPVAVLAGTICTVRRWDNTWNSDRTDVTLQDVGSAYARGDRLLLERDLTIRFAEIDATGQKRSYQTGDYWLIPARTVSGLEQWAVGQPQPPFGEMHSYAPLALVKIQGDGTVANPALDLRDMRDVFPTLRSLLTGVGSIVQGTGNRNRLPKWQGTDGSMLLNSNITDDGSQVEVGVPFKLPTGPAFDELSIDPTLSDDSDSAVPTEKAVKGYVDNLLMGSVAAFAIATPPAGWLECNGQQISRTDYARLFDRIGTTFGAGNGLTTFNVPDLRGEFIRGWDHGKGVDAGRFMGSFQMDQIQTHTHTDSGHTHSDAGHSHYDYGHAHPYYHVSSPGNWSPGLEATLANHGNWWLDNPGYANLTAGYANLTTGYANIGAPPNARSGEETRPRNVALLYCIKF